MSRQDPDNQAGALEPGGRASGGGGVCGYRGLLHGGDYNPEQWLDQPGALEEDLRLMREAGVNAVTLGVFSWGRYEPREGRYDFGWMLDIIRRLHEQGIWTILGTPSAAHPAWLSARYPGVLRVGPDGRRWLHGERVKYCLSSPVFRRKVAGINIRLAQAVRGEPGVILWHVSNEYCGACWCPLCHRAFRAWLRRRYGSLEALNRAWWNDLWSHRYSNWDQIHAFQEERYGEPSITGLRLDWRRFVTDLTVDFMLKEIEPLRKITPGIPVTTNLMAAHPGLNYEKFVPHMDVVSLDSYPAMHDRPADLTVGIETAFVHDLCRSFKRQPFLLMESAPTSPQWFTQMKLKRPGVHRLMCTQAVAHGADGVMYFQWRAGRGGVEKLHGAVVMHDGTGHTRVFREVAEVGSLLGRLKGVQATTVPAEVAIMYDWENRWGIDLTMGPHKDRKDYLGECVRHYRPFWQMGIPVDVVNEEADLAGYKLIIAPMLYMVRPGVAPRLEEHVRRGGEFVTTFWSGIADEHDLCFTGGRPGPLRKLLGIWSEELDVLYDDECAAVVPADDTEMPLSGPYRAEIFCDLVHTGRAGVLARYGSQFYAGRPALTVNRFGKGRAYYVAFRSHDSFLPDFYEGLAGRLGLRRNWPRPLPSGITVQRRMGRDRDFLFVMNFTPETKCLERVGRLGARDAVTGRPVLGRLSLGPYGSRVLAIPAGRQDAHKPRTGRKKRCRRVP